MRFTNLICWKKQFWHFGTLPHFWPGQFGYISQIRFLKNSFDICTPCHTADRDCISQLRLFIKIVSRFLHLATLLTRTYISQIWYKKSSQNNFCTLPHCWPGQGKWPGWWTSTWCAFILPGLYDGYILPGWCQNYGDIFPGCHTNDNPLQWSTVHSFSAFIMTGKMLTMLLCPEVPRSHQSLLHVTNNKFHLWWRTSFHMQDKEHLGHWEAPDINVLEPCLELGWNLTRMPIFAIFWTGLNWSEGLLKIQFPPIFWTRLNWSEGLLTMLLFPPPRGWFAFLSCKITLQYLMSTMWLLQMQTMRWFGKVSCRGEYWGRWNQCSALK